MLSLIIKTTRFLVYHVLIVAEDRFCRLPRRRVQPEVERLLREDLALKARLRALVLELKSERGARPKVSPRTRAAQVFAYLLSPQATPPSRTTTFRRQRRPSSGGRPSSGADRGRGARRNWAAGPHSGRT